MLAGLSKKREGRRRRATLQHPETTIDPLFIRLVQGASLAAFVLAGAATAAEAYPPVPRPTPGACQMKDRSGQPKQACADAQAVDAATPRRQRLNAEAQRDCRVLESAILESEQAERRGRAAMMESVQQDLFILRKRYRKLGC
jgi:hypothetical protein